MSLMRWRRNIVDELSTVVFIKVYLLPEGIQAMNLMEHIQTSDMSVITEAIGRWNFAVPMGSTPRFLTSSEVMGIGLMFPRRAQAASTSGEGG